ncbi:hypothetical protein [Methylobacterium marchantiae]|uniref:Large polyvalent protein associated domain-containing protein n=1 Tax=Methylobacterium marchantiae TaxID=600331 RepID=A0ABW3X3N1_9HYPH|nr:hypothetical protein AIGOOFII_3486 [Methylobacterium marchantiae]
MTLEELEALEAPAAPGTPAVPVVAPPAASSGVTAPVVPASSESPEGASPAASGPQYDPTQPRDSAARYDTTGQIGGAIVTGAAKSIYETKDFLFGKPEEGDKSDLRQGIERLDKSLRDASPANSFVSGLSQFATGMLGAGKIAQGAKLIPGVAGAVGAVEGVKGGGAVLQSAKAAAVGAVAFDPNGPRLSDLVQKFPALQNPVSAFLASAPGDSAALGRAKNALESIGVDVALAGVFAASVAGFKALKSGDQAAIQATQGELAQALVHKDAKLAISKGDAEAVEALRQEHPVAVAQAEEAMNPITVKPDGTGEVTLPEQAVTAGEKLPVETKDVAQQAAQAEGSQVQRVDSPTQGAGEAGLPPRPKLIGVSEEQVSKLVADGIEDTTQIMGPGGWEGAIDRGYKFGDGGSIPWQKFARVTQDGPDPLDFMVARIADDLSGPLAKLKGGDAQGVMGDAQMERMIAQRVQLWNEDPQALATVLAEAGKNAKTMSANMEAGFLVANRVMTDLLNKRSRVALGMTEEWGHDIKAARADLEEHLQVAATVFGHAQAMRGSAGRAMRRMHSEFQPDFEMINSMKSLDDVKFFTLLDSVGHDMAVAARLAKPSLWKRIKDDASYLLVNNLLWGLRTHAVNTLTNSYMILSRPAERAIGFSIQGDLTKAADHWRQYGYLKTAISESWRDAVQAWKIGDSIIEPHSMEVFASGTTDGRGTNWAAEGFKQWDSIPNVLTNAYTGFMKAAGLPTRTLGAMDELAKQTTYRSKVMANAHADGLQAGLEGPALATHVRKTLFDSFDDAGRAVDVNALEEASTATFQQDLLAGSFGKSMQNMVANHELLRFVVPFIKTPTNVLRMGFKLTPGLNMLQAEYRSMIRGDMGQEKQAQAIGQMAMGTLFMGTAATLAVEGRITGGGPSDPKKKAALMATGWQPYSVVLANDDGSKTYVNFGRFDPVAMPLGIIADIIDVASRDSESDGAAEKAQEMAAGLLLGLVKQLGQKTYLKSLSDTINAIVDPGEDFKGGKMGKAIGQQVTNLVPFSSGLRFVNPDPNLRETRGILDKVMSTIPGLSERLPAKMDVFGDPLTVHKGLWVDGEKTAVDAEVRRMIDEDGHSIGPPNPSRTGADLRDVQMKDGRNAFEVYQELAGHPPGVRSMKDAVAKIMKTAAYQKAPDGDESIKGTKLSMLTGTISKYREAAFKRLMADENVRAAVHKHNLDQKKAVAAAYAKPAPNAQQQGADALTSLGKAFGVPLGGANP